MNENLLNFGFKFQKCPFLGCDCWVYEEFDVPHIDQIGDRFVFYPETKTIRDFKLLLPSKQVNSFTDIENYIIHSKYFD